MKKVLFVLVLLMLGGKPVFADLSIKDTLDRFPLKQGVAYSLYDSGIDYLSTFEVLNIKGVSFEVGYATEDKMVGVISYQILDLGKYITTPFLKELQLNVGWYVGASRIALHKIEDNNEFEMGPSLTLLNVRW